jgi:hypothetical protein
MKLIFIFVLFFGLVIAFYENDYYRPGQSDLWYTQANPTWRSKSTTAVAVATTTTTTEEPNEETTTFKLSATG